MQGEISKMTPSAIIKDDHRYDLKKHVAAIHSANKLSLVQRKIANALLFNAYNKLLDQNEHSIHIKSLCDLIGYNSNEQKAIKKALVSLISTVIEWNLVDKNKIDSEGIWNASAIIADASIDGAVCTYSYSQKMRQLLHSPEMYGRLNLKIQAKFKSSYGLALYENCIRYQNINTTPWFDMVTFRKLMGVDEGKYSAFKDFRKRVIDMAVKEVNQYSHLMVDYSLKKAGRKFVSIQFTINSQQQMTPLLSQSNSLSDCLRNDFGFSQPQIDEVLNQFEDKYILNKISIVKNSKSYQSGKILNLAQYLHGALQNDYQEPKSSQTHLRANQHKKTHEAKQQQQHAVQKSTYDKYKQQQFMLHYTNTNEKRREQLSNLFIAEITGTIYDNLYVRDGLDNAIVQQKFTQFLKEQGEQPKVLLGFDEYILSMA